MAARLLTRLVSGLGAATKDAALPLARQALHEPWHASQIAPLTRVWHQCAALGANWARATPSASFASAAAAASPAPHAEVAAAASTGRAGPSGPATAVMPESAASPAPLPDPKADLVEKLLSSEMYPTAAQRRMVRLDVLRDFQRHPEDTGSPQVMVAMWTHRVRELVRTFDANRKNLPAIRELEMMVNRRRRLLIWLRRADFQAYSYTITKLGLKDIYTPTSFADRYREGMRHTDPVTDDSVNRWRFGFHRKYRQKKTSLWRRLRPKLVSEDPQLEATDQASAAASKQHRQQQRAAQQQAAQQQLQEHQKQA